MEKRKMFSLFLLLLVGTFLSCGNNDEDQDGSGGDGTEVKSDYTATSQVKTVTLERLDVGFKEAIVVYEDFNRKYALGHGNGCLYLLPYERVSGGWKAMVKLNYSGWIYDNVVASDKIAIKDIGKVSDLSSITAKIKPSDMEYGDEYPVVQPNHGYAISFKTEENEVKYMRAYCTKYTLGEFGQLSTVTIQYQLY